MGVKMAQAGLCRCDDLLLPWRMIGIRRARRDGRVLLKTLLERNEMLRHRLQHPAVLRPRHVRLVGALLRGEKEIEEARHAQLERRCLLSLLPEVMYLPV